MQNNNLAQSSLKTDKIKVALVLCPCWTNLTPPLGIAYLAAVLEKEGCQAKCFDLNIKTYNLFKKDGTDYWNGAEYYRWQEPLFYSQILPIIEDYLEREAVEILSYNPEIIGFSIFNTSVSASLFLAEKIKLKNPRIKIIFGGYECYKEICQPRFLNTGFIDAVVIGEGEQTLVELVKIYCQTGNFQDIRGVLVKKNGQFLNGGLREEFKNLDNLPFPSFRDFNLIEYKDFALPLMASRGCIGRCNFCGEIKYWNSFRFRSAVNVFNELRQENQYYGVKNFFFNDSLINGNLKELEKLADLIIENKLEVCWGGNARIHHGISLELLKKLRSAGCFYFIYGIESGSQKILNHMDKLITIKDAEKNLADTAKAGMEANVNWIVGFPTESWFDFTKSLFFIYKNMKNISNVNPGQGYGIAEDSVIAKNPQKYGITDKLFLNNWRTKYFRNTIIHRRLRLKILRWWLSLLGVKHT